MKIRRRTEDYGLPAGVIEVELTPEELEQAFREKQKEYRLADVKDAIEQAYEWEIISEEEYEKVIDNESFQEAVLDEYERRFSCNVPENVTWEESLKEILKEVDKYAATDDN